MELERSSGSVEESRWSEKAVSWLRSAQALGGSRWRLASLRCGKGVGLGGPRFIERSRREEKEAAGAGSLEAGGEASRRSTSFVPARLQMRGTESRWAGPELPASCTMTGPFNEPPTAGTALVLAPCFAAVPAPPPSFGRCMGQAGGDRAASTSVVRTRTAARELGLAGLGPGGLGWPAANARARLQLLTSHAATNHASGNPYVRVALSSWGLEFWMDHRRARIHFIAWQAARGPHTRNRKTRSTVW